MFKRLSYLFLCAIVLSGCGKFSLGNKEQADQTGTGHIAEEETNLDQNNNTVSMENDADKKVVEDTDSMVETVNTPDENKTDTENDTHEVSNNQEVKSETVAKKYCLPDGFVYVDDVIPTVELDIRYYTDYNFVGEKIDGYVAPLAILTTKAAEALKVAAEELAKDGYTFRIYDAYRPQKAVAHFVRWAQTEDATMKETFYPSMEKSVLFQDGYISDKSRHSRGSTVDLTIVDKNGNEVDMGGYFDLLDTVSNYDTDAITDTQHANREYLKRIMDKAGFNSIRTEWWHFQLREEPYPDTYFDFDID